MNSYLNLIPIFAKAHKRQNRMTLICIISAVFLVTSIFSMADMGITMEQKRLLSKHCLDKLNHSAMAETLYIVAIFLFILILIAGVLMISSSINSNVTQRTKFFAMMRCIGMSKQQIIKFVRLESLNWCKIAIPIGLIIGIIITWLLCLILHYFVAGEFSDIPIFKISFVGIISGILVGLITVIIAASSPAKRASKVSPISAICDNLENFKINHVVNDNFKHIDISLGFNHAISSKKNFILIISSFSLSIVLFLSFSVLVELIGYIMPQPSNYYDISISSKNFDNSIDYKILDKISSIKDVKQAFGRKKALDIMAKINSKYEKIDIISYDKFDLDCLVKDKQLIKGSDIEKIYKNNNYILAIFDEKKPLKIGEKIKIYNKNFEIAGLLKCNPFSDSGNTDGKITIITTGKTFFNLTNIDTYSLIFIQLKKNANNESLLELNKILDENTFLNDKRDQNTSKIYFAFMLFIYSFLIIITLVTILNIINSISMSTSARIKQYKIMLAIGMNKNQIIKMIAAEAFSYSIFGCILGILIGLFSSKFLYTKLITSHFKYAKWNIPFNSIFIIVFTIIFSTIIAIYYPSKRIHHMSINDNSDDL